MKKNRFLAAAIIASAVAGVSCNRNTPIVVPDDQRAAVQFSSNIVTMNSVSRASANSWAVLDIIGIYMYEENTLDVVETKENIPYFTETGGATGSFKPQGAVIYFPDNGDKVRFMAYYPYKGVVTDDSDVFKVDVSDQSDQSAIDLLYSFHADAKYDKKSPGRKVSLVFTHQLTKVYVNVKAGDGLTNDDLTNVAVSFAGLNTKADFALASGVLSNASAPQPIALKSATTPQNYAAGFESIVLPSATIPTAQIVFDLNNGDEGSGVASDQFTWNFDQALAPHAKHTLNATISRSGIVVEATITDWIDTDENDIVAD